MIPKTANKQLKTKEFVSEVIDKKETKIPKAAKKEPSLKPSNEDTEAQSQKPSSKTSIFLGTLFLVFLGIATNSLVAYFSYQDGRQNGYQDGRQNGITSILKVAKARVEIEYYRNYSYGVDLYISPSEYSDDSQMDIVDDIMAVAKKYEEECKELSKRYAYVYRVTDECLEKLKEKHYLVSCPHDPETCTTFLQL